MESSCQVCGKPVVLPDMAEDEQKAGEQKAGEQKAGEQKAGGPVSGLVRRATYAFAKMVTHSEKPEGANELTCYELMLRRLRGKDEAALLAERMQTLAGVVPPEFQGTRFDHPMMRTPEAVAALEWTMRPNGLFLVGPSGRGKSRCAYEILRRHHMEGAVCCQYSAAEWAFKCLGMQHAFREFSRWIELVKACDILMIDDLGKSRLTFQDHQATQATELLFDTIDRRIKDQLPTFVTTNLASKDFTERWGAHGDAFLRRLIEYSCCVKFGGTASDKIKFGAWH